MGWEKCGHSPTIKWGLQCVIVEKIDLNLICCIVDTTIVNISLQGGTWGGRNVGIVLQLKGVAM